MQILPINNRNFLKPSRNPSYRSKVKILGKKIFGQLIKKIWFRVCSVTTEMFEHQNSVKNQRKRSEIFFKNLRRAYTDLIQAKKNSKLSRACVPLTSLNFKARINLSSPADARQLPNCLRFGSVLTNRSALSPRTTYDNDNSEIFNSFTQNR